MVRAKFTVSAITQYAGGSIRVELMPVYGDTEENKKFWHATPSGKIEMNINGEAAKAFEVGKAYYVDFHLVASSDTI